MEPITRFRWLDLLKDHDLVLIPALVFMIVVIISIVIFSSYKRKSSALINDLRQKDKLYLQLLKNVNQIIFIIDEHHHIVDMNDYACSLLHYSKRELRDVNFKNLIPQEYWHQLTPDYVRNSMIGKHINRVLISKNNDLLPVAVYTIEHSFDNLTFFIEFYTDRVAIDRANLISKFIDDKFRAVFDLSLNSIIVTDENETVLDCNSSFEAMTRYRKTELRRKKIDAILKPYAHDHFLNSDVMDEDIINKERYSTQTVANCTVQTKDDGIIPAFYNRAIIEFGTERRIFYFINDIVSNAKIELNLKGVKADLDRFYNKTHDAVFILADDQRILFANDRALKVLQYEQQDIEQIKFSELLRGKYLDSWDNACKNLDLDNSCSEISLVLNSRNDRQVHVEGCIYRKHVALEDQIYCIFHDVSEILQTTEALKQSQIRYLDLYDNAPDMYFTIDINGIIRLVNKYGAEYLGYTKEELIGKPVWIVVYQEDIDTVKKQIHQILSGKQEKSHLEFRKVRKDGTIIYVAESVRLILGKNQAPKELRIICADKTHQIKAIQALRDSEEKYRKLIEESNDAIYLLYNDRFEFINRKFQEMFGYSQEEVKKPDFHVMDLVAPNSEMIVKGRRDGLADAQDKGDRYEFTAVNRNGEFIDVEVSVYHIDYNGSVATQGIVRDITERKQMEKELKKSEAYFRTLFEGARDAILVESIDGQIFDVNEAACHLYGYSRDELIRSSVIDLLPPEMIEKLPEIEQSLRAGHDFYVAEAENIHKDGHLIPVEVSTSFVQIDNTPRVIAVVRDVTERKIAEQEKLDGIHYTVSALAKAIELRDPHTYGHSARVAQIAEIIARELHWSEDRILGIRLAAELHDIGKIAIPAEILSKPAKLNDLEYTIVQEHVEKGHEILKDIKLPFPIAEAVYQHHELLDGSGYPRGLKGEEIIDEARIIGIADILETFTSHRPYRPALGLKKAMEMLTGDSIERYDRKIVQLVDQLISNNNGEPFWNM